MHIFIKEVVFLQKRKFIQNVFIMSSSMLIVRIMGMASNIYISSLAGAKSMGIYHMVFSVFTFGMTFASSGTGFAVTRLIAEGRANEKSVLKKCLLIAWFMSALGFVFFFFGSSFAGAKLIHHRDGSLCLKILSFALPCMASSSVMRGYFIAKRRAVFLTISSITEESISIAFSLMLLKVSSMPSYICLIISCTVSNLFAFVLDSILCRACLKKSIHIPSKAKLKDIFAICVPIALGSYLRTGLVSCENLIIPLQFGKFGTTDPVAEYGIIKAMAMPILMFPTVFVQAFSSMLVPEMSEMNAKGRPNGIRHVSQISLNTVTMFAFFIALMLFKHHDIISNTFYKEKGVSFYLGMLSLLAVPMYLDTVADSILKGLNLQNASLRYNIIDSFLRITSILIFMPKFGPVFYIIMLYVSEIFNLGLSLNKAAKTVSLKIDFVSLLLKPLLCSCAAFFFSAPLVQAGIYIALYFAGDIKNRLTEYGQAV